MTPLAEVWKLGAPELKDKAGLRAIMPDMHFFDVRGVEAVIDRMAGEMWKKRAASVDLAKMAAPAMWFQLPGGAVVLLRLDMPDGRRRAQIMVVHGVESHIVGSIGLGPEILDELATIAQAQPGANLEQVDTEFRLHALAYLALVNDRGIAAQISRKLSRQQRRAHERDGTHAPLEAWTEITLHYQRPIRGGHGNSDRSGVMPLHFVLGHDRHVFGVKRYIDGYWRGDEDNGVKRTRYKLAA